MRLTAVAFAALLLSPGCSARQHPATVVPANAREGRTSVRILQSESKKSQVPNAVAETITPAYASDDNKLPEYPAHALRAGCRQGLVPIRLYIGVDGNVARVLPIPSRPVAEDLCHSAFWAATCVAVETWRFSPAFRQTPQPGPDVDGDGRPDFTRWEQKPTMIYLDFEFTFRVVEGKGQVLSR